MIHESQKLSVLRELIDRFLYAANFLNNNLYALESNKHTDKELTVVFGLYFEISKLIEEIFGNSNYEQNIRNALGEDLHREYIDSKTLMNDIRKELGTSFEQSVIYEIEYGLKKYQNLIGGLFSDYELSNIDDLKTGWDLDHMYWWRDRIEIGLSLIDSNPDVKAQLEQKIKVLDKELKNKASDSKWVPIIMTFYRNLKETWHPKEFWWWHLKKFIKEEEKEGVK